MIGRVLVTVATETGQDAFALLDRPWCQVLYTFYQLAERDERRALASRASRVDAGLLTALAFNEPQRLSDELRSVQEAIAAFERGPVDEAADVAEWKARGLALAAKLDQGRVLSPDALTGIVS